MAVLQVPSVYDPLIVVPDGKSTKVLQDFFQALVLAIPANQPLYVKDFGAAGDGVTNDTRTIQKAINTAVQQGGGSVILSNGTYLVDTLTFPAGSAPIAFIGQGESSILKRQSDLADGKGMLDILGSNVAFDNFAIEGGVTVPVGLLYNADFMVGGNNDPMAPVLTKNSSIWLHGGTSNFSCQRLAIRHTGGYAALIDAGSAGIRDVRFVNCKFENNRPHLFGIAAGAAIYGSWTGGIFATGSGSLANPGCVAKRIFVSQCQFTRGTGNQFWTHLSALDELHETFLIYDNFCEDIGLDGVLIGGVSGGAVSNNVFHRIGYVTTTDDDRPVPRWLPNLNATALDSSGLVIGVNYQGNSIISCNGGAIDGDGHSDSSWAGNLIRIPVVGDLDYDSDSISISGASNSGSTSYGCNLGNTSNTPAGGKNISIVGNTLLNLPAGSIRLYSARNCLVEGNNVVAPASSIAPPIAYGPGGPGANQQPTGNIIKHNRVQYSPPAPAPVVFEDPTVGPFTAADVNYVFGNNPIVGNGLAVEFQKNVNSGSPTYASTVWF